MAKRADTTDKEREEKARRGEGAAEGGRSRPSAGNARSQQAGGQTSGTGSGSESGKRKGSGLRGVPTAFLVGFIVALVLVVGIVAFLLWAPGASSKVQKDDYVTTAMLQDAVEIENLSTAEFVYNGIAEHYRSEEDAHNPLFFWESDDPVDFRVSYKATVKATIAMSDVGFEVDEDNRVVKATLPEITLSSHVNPDSMQFIPEGTDADMQAIFEVCETDVEQEASESGELYATAEENMRSAIEGLTLPILQGGGYSLEWAEEAI